MRNSLALLPLLTTALLGLPPEVGLSPLAAQQPAPSGPSRREPRKMLHDKLPVFHWDMKVLETLGTIATTRYDTTGNRIVWLIETKKFIHPGRVAPMFYDDEGSRLTTMPDLEFTLLPKQKDDKFERVQVVLKLPGKEVLKESFRVVLFKAAN
jgi:hypothetical protein